MSRATQRRRRSEMAKMTVFVTILLTAACGGFPASSAAVSAGSALTVRLSPGGAKLALRMIGTPHPWAGQSDTEGNPRSGHDGRRTSGQGTEKRHRPTTQPRRDRRERNDG